jgi:hypothetical protein
VAPGGGRRGPHRARHQPDAGGPHPPHPPAHRHRLGRDARGERGRAGGGGEGGGGEPLDAHRHHRPGPAPLARRPGAAGGRRRRGGPPPRHAGGRVLLAAGHRAGGGPVGAGAQALLLRPGDGGHLGPARARPPHRRRGRRLPRPGLDERRAPDDRLHPGDAGAGRRLAGDRRHLRGGGLDDRGRHGPPRPGRHRRPLVLRGAGAARDRREPPPPAGRGAAGPDDDLGAPALRPVHGGAGAAAGSALGWPVPFGTGTRPLQVATLGGSVHRLPGGAGGAPGSPARWRTAGSAPWWGSRSAAPAPTR